MTARTLTTRHDLRAEIKDRFGLNDLQAEIASCGLWLRHDAPHHGDWSQWLDALTIDEVDDLLGGAE